MLDPVRSVTTKKGGAMADDDEPRPVRTVTVGEGLSALSIEDLRERIEALSAEIKRTEVELASKREGLAKAEAVFSKS